MKLAVHLPPECMKNGVLISECAVKVADCEVISVLRFRSSALRRRHGLWRRTPVTSYIAVVRFPAWVEYEHVEKYRLTGVFSVSISRTLNPRWQPPTFAPGSDEAVIEAAQGANHADVI